jgi:glycosyltransferase involved in cell wall biosynthesis
MRVLQMGPYSHPPGGVQTNLVAIRRLLLSRGIPCAVINLTRNRDEDGDGIYYPRNPLETLKLLARLRYDIIHLHIGGDLSTRLMMLALVCSLIPRSKTVLSFHSGGYPRSKAGKRVNPLTFRGFVLRRLDSVIGVNQELKNLFLRFGVPERRIRMIRPHAISPDSIERSLPERLSRFFQAHDPTLLTVGGLEPEYDLPLQINVLAQIRERFPGAGLAIIGSGSLEAELRELIQSKPYAEHVMLCGDVPNPITLRAIAESDLLLRTTLYDGDSISVREALFIGTPIIATDNGMRPDGVSLIPCSDPDALRRTIEAVLTHPAPERSPGDAGERNIEEVFELYKELLEPS